MIVLGVIQGLTEFFPVSSKGHLALGERLLGVDLHTSDELATEIALHVGTLLAVALFVWRDGAEVRLTAAVGDMPKETAEVDNPSEPAKSELGLALAPLDRDARRQYGIPAKVNGVLVQSVSPDSPAAEKGIRSGDVIVKIAGQSVDSPADVAERVAAAQDQKRKSVLLLVNRQGNERFIALPLTQA